MAHRRFANDSLAEEAAIFVVDSLERNNWQKLSSFKGRSSFQTFLSSITFRLLEDFSRSKFGRIRPPLWVQNLGGIWSLLFTFLCMERLKRTEAVECVASRVQTATREEVEDAALHLLAEITDCGSQQALEVPLNEENLSGNYGNEPASIQEQLEEKEKELFLSSLFSQPVESEEGKMIHREAAKILVQDIVLHPQERLLLKLCYQDDMRVTAAGKLLGLNRHQVHGRLRRLLGRLRDDFIQKGVDVEILQLLKD